LHAIHAQGLGHAHVAQATFTLHIGQRDFRLQPMVKQKQERARRGVQAETFDAAMVQSVSILMR
jgi:hypothetical protein